MREDIVGGLKNALDKGENLEQAVRTFVNAGYPEREVREAARYATSGILSSLEKVKSPEIKKNKPTIKKLENQRIIKKQKTKHESKIGVKIILLGATFLILTGILISSIFFREQILSFFNERFG
jgi:hypothetical protein